MSRRKIAITAKAIKTNIAMLTKTRTPHSKPPWSSGGIEYISVIHKPATKAYKGINPFTKEEQMFKAKPARNVVKVRALKSLKDMA